MFEHWLRAGVPVDGWNFTFTQIAYLVDAYRRQVSEHGVVNYSLFVSYFPHLIAGPILHHKEMIPQFRDRSRFTAELFSVGLTDLYIRLVSMGIIRDWRII